jgi:Domain of unknown function (DUF4962)/Heparinase II/III-like protein
MMKMAWMSLLMGSLLEAASAAVVGPFSGVSASNITETPLWVHPEVFAAAGRSLANISHEMDLAEKDGQPVAVTKPGFTLEFARELAAGCYKLEVWAAAPAGASDSLWVAVDGRRQKRPLDFPIGKFDNRSMLISLGQGRHTFELTVHKKPGCMLAGVTLSGFASRIPRPALREPLRGQHPRLLFSRADLAALRARLADPRVQRFYRPAPARTSRAPAYKPGTKGGGGFLDLHYWALSQLLEPQPEKLRGVLDWLETATTYPDCGVDLGAGYFMVGVALSYDWLYDQIPDDLRRRVRDTIARQGRALYEASLGGYSGGGQSIQQNHFWYSHLALALAAAAVYDEVPEARQWLPWAWDRYERIALTFSPDGSYHEGPSYWSFSMPALYLYTDLYEHCTGLRIPAGDQGLMGQAEFRFHYLYPGLRGTAPMEDSLVDNEKVPIEPLLWEAMRFKSRVPMSIAARLVKVPSSNSFSLLWLDESVPVADITQVVPQAHYYRDVETAFARTSWNDDATYVAFVSRPFGGHVWAELCAQFTLGGTGHDHPEQNHFVLFGRGEVLAADTGYTYDKETRDHNSVLVDGKGQYWDGKTWCPPSPGRAHLTQFVAQDDVAIMAGDATSAYPPEVGLTQFLRTLVLAGPDLVVVHDRLRADRPRTFSWLLHHYGQSSRDGGGWQIVRHNARLGVMPLLPRGLTAEETTYRPKYIQPGENHTPAEPDVHLLELKTPPLEQTSFLVPLLIGQVGDKLPAVSDVSNNTCEAVRSGDTVVAFNRGNGRMSVAAPWGDTLETDAVCVVARLRGQTRQIIRAPAGSPKR